MGLIITKKLLPKIYAICFSLFPSILAAQTQYDYYEDREIIGGADNALNGIVIIFLLIIVAFVLLIIANFYFKVYNWFHPQKQPKKKTKLNGEYQKRANCMQLSNINQTEKLEVPNNSINLKEMTIVPQQKTSDSSIYTDEGYRAYIATYELTIKPKSSDLMRDIYSRNMYVGDKLVSVIRGAGFNNIDYDINPKEGTKIICDGAYDDYNKRHAHTISIPNSVIAIGNNAFMFMSLSEITIPSSVKYITGNPFCNRCEIIRCLSTRFSYEKMCLLSKEQSLLIADLSKNEKIKRTPDGIKYIGRGAYRSHDIQIMIISSSVVAIADNAFAGEDLFVLKFEGKTEIVEKSIWERCPNIKAIRIPNGTLEHYKDIIPQKYHEYLAESKQDETLNSDFIRQLIRTEDKKRANSSVAIYPKSYIVDVTKEEKNYIKKERKNYDLSICLESDLDSSIKIEDKYDTGKEGVTKCEAAYSADGKKFLKLNYDLYKDSILSDYIVKRGTTIICDYSFTRVHNHTIKLPSSVRVLGNNIFISAKLNTLEIPKSVKYITGNPFVLCRVNLINKSPNFVLENGILYDKDKSKIISVIKEVTDTSLYIPYPILVIGRDSFHGLFFTNCSQLDIPSSVRYIEESAFQDSGLSQISFCNEKSVVEIGEYAFAWSSVKRMFLPYSLQSLGKNAFVHCKYLEVVTLSPNMEVIEEGTFSGCLTLNHVHIPEGVKVLKKECFFMCESLDDVYLPNSLELIEVGVFSLCPLRRVVLSKRTIVSHNAFPSSCEIIYREKN